MPMTLNSMRKSFNKSGKWILGIVTVAMLVLSFSGLGANYLANRGATAAGNVKDPTVATVNGANITRSQFEDALSKQRQQEAMMQQPQSVMNAPAEHAQVLNSLINDQLFLQIAQQHGITVSSSEIDAARKQQLAGLTKTLGLPASASEDQINAALQQRGQPPIDQLLPDDQIRPQLILQKYNAELMRDTKASDQDVRAFFRQSHVRHILISDKKRSDVQAQALANHVLDKLKGGADFTTLALQY